MFFDEAGWGHPREPAPRPVITPRQERIVLWLLLANMLFLFIAPIGGGTVVEGVAALMAGRGKGRAIHVMAPPPPVATNRPAATFAR